MIQIFSPLHFSVFLDILASRLFLRVILLIYFDVITADNNDFQIGAADGFIKIVI